MIQPRGEIAAAQIRQYEKSAQTIIFHPPFRIPKIFFVGGAIDMSVFAEIFFKHAEYGGFRNFFIGITIIAANDIAAVDDGNNAVQNVFIAAFIKRHVQRRRRASFLR